MLFEVSVRKVATCLVTIEAESEQEASEKFEKGEFEDELETDVREFSPEGPFRQID